MTGASFGEYSGLPPFFIASQHLGERNFVNVEVWQAIGSLSPGVAVGVVCLYFFNTMTVKYLEERRQMILDISAERNEWNAKLERLIDRYDSRVGAAIAAMEKVAHEDHAMRGRVQENILVQEKHAMTIIEMLRSLDNRLRGGGDD